MTLIFFESLLPPTTTVKGERLPFWRRKRKSKGNWLKLFLQEKHGIHITKEEHDLIRKHFVGDIWIDVKKTKPSTDRDVLVRCKNGNTLVDWYDSDVDGWSICFNDEITSWTEIPPVSPPPSIRT